MNSAAPGRPADNQSHPCFWIFSEQEDALQSKSPLWHAIDSSKLVLIGVEFEDLAHPVSRLNSPHEPATSVAVKYAVMTLSWARPIQ
jgi:hypothetical protein